MINMEKVLVDIDGITKDYGSGRGNFNVSIKVHEGEALGIVGENGAGKTTLLRTVMGFIKQDSGTITVMGMDSYRDAAKIKQYVGYVPGEINFPDYKSGIQFLRSYADMVGVKDFKYADSLIERLQLDIRAYPKRMSKGMKQKTAIVTALMIEAPLILMDEPTTGLDPLMREEFLSIVSEEKERGATIIMTSNSVEELERVCDTVVLFSQGKIVDVADVSSIKNRNFRDYKIEFNDNSEYEKYVTSRAGMTSTRPNKNQVIVRVEKDRLNDFFGGLSELNIKFITELPYNLSSYFEERRK